MSQHSTFRFWLNTLLLFTLGFCLSGCGTTAAVSTLRLTADNPSLTAGGSTQLHAMYSQGYLGSDATASATWTSSSPAVATVSSSGVLTGLTAGSTVIGATYKQSKGSLSVTIGGPSVGSLQLSPQNASLFTNGTQQYTATATYANGTTGDASATVQWAVVPANVATISAGGLLTAMAPGGYAVTATSGSQSAVAAGSIGNAPLASLAISPATPTVTAGSTLQFTATGMGTDQTTRDLTSSVTWTSSDPSVLGIDVHGLATTYNSTYTAASATVTAKTGTFSASVLVQVNPAVPTALYVVPTSSSIANATAEPHRALAFYADGSRRDVTAVSQWGFAGSSPAGASRFHAASAHASAAATTVATVDNSGTDTAVNPGMTMLQATFGTMQAQSTVIVTSATATSLSTSATNTVFQVGATQQVNLIGLFSDGSKQDITLTGNWQSSNPAVATIDSKGVATGVSAGTVQFTGSFGGLTVTTPLFHIVPTGLTSVLTVVRTGFIVKGLTEPLRLMGVYDDGSMQDLTDIATWKSTDPSVLSVDSKGLANGITAGTVQVTGTVQGYSSTRTIVVAPFTLIALKVVPTVSSFPMGTSLPYTALGFFSDGVVVNISDGVIWSSTDPSVFTINANGRAKSGNLGTAKVGATLLGMTAYSDSSTVYVSPLKAIRITPSGGQIAATTSRTLVAQGTFADGTTQDITLNATWTSSNTTVATVDAAGVVEGNFAGTSVISATMQGIAASTTLKVTNAVITSVALTPASSTLAITTGGLLTLTGTFSDGTVQQLNGEAVWSTDNPKYVDTTQGGIVRGISVGSSTVSAQRGRYVASAFVNVTNATLSSMAFASVPATLPVGLSQQYNVTGTFSDGSTQDLATNLLCSSSNQGVASIDSNQVVSATAIGTTQITCSFQNTKSVTTTLQVVGNYLSSIAITPATATIVSGTSQQFTAMGSFPDRTTLDLSKSVNWTSSDPATLQIDSNGVATANNNTGLTKTVTLTAQMDAQSGPVTSSVTVQVASVATVTAVVVTPTSSSIASGTAESHRAIAWYTDGSQQDVTSLATWSVPGAAASAVSGTRRLVAAASANSVVSVDAQGINQGISPGTAAIQASFGGSSSQSVVIVTPATLTALNIRATRDLFQAGSDQQVQLIGTFSDGTHQDISLNGNWRSSNPDVATISGAGLAHGVSAGAVQFTASFGGLTASTIGFQVLPPNLLSITIGIDYPSLPIGASEYARVTGTYADGTTHDLTSLATWKSADPTVFPVDSTGGVYGLSPGTTQITATVQGKSALLNVAAIATTLTSIEILPAQPAFALATTLDFVALGKFSNGAVADVTKGVIWRSANPAVLTINGLGRAKAGTQGATTVSASLLGITQVSNSVQVTPATLAILRLSPSTSRLAALTGQQYVATGIFNDGTFQDLTADVTWNTTDNTIASIDTTGLGIGMRPGQVQITATFMGQAVSIPLTVTGATLVSTSLTPGNPELPVGITRQFSLTGTFSDGTTQDLSYDAIWQAPTPSIVDVILQGQAIGASPGIGEINAQRGYFSASSPIRVTNASLSSLSITPSTARVRKGSQTQIVANGTFSDGFIQDLASSVTFSSDTPGVATVSRYGLVSAIGLGSSRIAASFRGQTATMSGFQVVSDALTAIAVTPSSVALGLGGTQQLTATGTYSDGTTADVTRIARWTSSDPTILNMDENGLATSFVTPIIPTSMGIGSSSDRVGLHAAGRSMPFVAAATTPITVTAQYGGASGSASVTVPTPGSTTPTATLTSLTVVPTSSRIAAGTTEQLKAIASYSDGTTQDASGSVTWSTGNAAIATIAATGIVSGVAPGTVSLQAQLGSFQSNTVVIVTSATLTSVAISPSGASLAAGTTQQFTLTGTFSDGSTQNLNSSATWTTSNAAVATISSNGMVDGLAAGSVQFTGTFNGQSATSATVQVTPATLGSLAVVPANPSFAKGTSQQLRVLGLYSDGTTQDLTGVAAYSSTDPTVVAISPSGLAMGIGVGSTQVAISAGGLTATTQTVTVTASTLASLAITPRTPVFAGNTTQQFTVTGTFADGTQQDLSTQAIWTSSNPQVLTIDQNGLATGGTPGSAQVSATILGVTATTGSVQVTSATLTNLTLTPTTAQIAKGSTRQFAVTGTFSDGTTQDLSSNAIWTSSNGAVVSIDAKGRATGTGIGSAQLTASFMGKTVSTSSFQVSPATLISIAFSPSNPRVAKGTGEPVAVIGTFSDGTTQDITGQAIFSSSNTTAATVSTTGVVTGVAAGTSTISVQVDGLTSSYTVTVSNATLSSLAIAPNAPASIAKGRTQQFTATGTFSDGTTQNLSSSVIWTSSNPAVFTIDGNGLVTGTGVGNGQLTATSQGQTATTQSFQVTPAVPTTLAVGPANSSLAAGATRQFTAILTYSDGTTEDVTSSATWSSSSNTVATITSAGLVTAVSSGVTIITSQSNGLSNAVSLLVTSSATTITGIALTPASQSIAAGGTQQYTATATFADGTTQNVTSSVAWSSSSDSVATINALGLASAASQGTTTVVAQLSGRSATATLTVTAATLASVSIIPGSAAIAKGSAQQFAATGIYTDGSTQDLTAQTTWQSSATTVATVDSNGLASGLHAGSTQISATIQGRSAMATLIVSPATLVHVAVTPAVASTASGTAQQYKAAGTMSDGSTQDLTTSVAWSSSNTPIATINAAGLATTALTGTTTITATAGGVTGTATLTVTSASAVSIQLSPATVSLPAGDVLQLIATATFTDGTSQDVTSSATFTTSNAAVAAVDINGKLRGTGPGNATITATLGAATVTANVTISSATLSSIAITPATLTLAAGTSQQLTATGTFSDGSTQDLTSSITWSSSAPSVVLVSATGNVVVAQTGNATITATSGGVSATLSVTGSPATITAISVSPATVNLATGQTQQFAATATLSDGTQQTITTSAQWSVSNPAKATVGNSAGSYGFLTTSAAGVISVTASAGSVSGSAAVTIQSATLVFLAIAPSPVSLAAGTTQPLTVTGTYSDGSTANLNGSATWSSSNSSAATVSASGLVRGTAAGQATITVTVQGVSSTVLVTISTATLNSVAITPASPSIAAGLNTQLTATGTYTDGSTANLSSLVQWSSSAPAVATVGGTGLLRGLAPGNAMVTATYQGTSAQVPVTVTSATLQSIAVQAAQSSFALGLSLPLQAVGTYSDGTTQDLSSLVTWSSQNPTIGVVSSTGLATGVSLGTFYARVAYGGVTGTLALTVSNAVLQSITVTPANSVIVNLFGSSVQFTATGHFSDGSTQNITSAVHWAVTSGVSIGSISQTGKFTSLAVGIGTVTATSGTISGSTGITVVHI